MGTPTVQPRPRAIALSVAAALAACASSGPFVWVDGFRDPEEKSSASGAEYRIAPGDVLSVSVWNQDGVSIPRTRVREDGRISIAFLQDVEVSGLTPTELSARLQGKLKAFIVNPVVTVSVEEIRPSRISVVGKVGQPGSFDLPAGAGVLHALAAAHGLNDFADHDAIFVLRPSRNGGAPARIRFRYQALTDGDARSVGFRLHDGDVVVVE